MYNHTEQKCVHNSLLKNNERIMNGNEKSLVSNALQMIPHLPHKQCECGVNAHKKCSLALVHHTKRSREKKKLMNGKDGREKNKTTLMMCRKRIETLSLYEMLIFAVVFFVVVVVNAAAFALVPAINVHSKLPLTMAFMQRQMVRNNLVKFVQMKWIFERWW